MVLKVTFVSNYINHHQIPFSNCMYEMLGDKYTFIQTAPMEKERIKMGWGLDENKIEYVKNSYESNKTFQECMDIIDESDVVIIGSASRIFIKNRLKNNKLTFIYSERIFKTGLKKLINPYYLFRYIQSYLIPNMKTNTFALCASAYAAYDFSRIGAFEGRTYKWGYFPKYVEYDIDTLLKKKENKVIRMLWVGRFLKLKCAEDAIITAKKLINSGYDFTFDIIGDGPEKSDLIQLANESGLDDKINFLGLMPPEKVREYMEHANIFLFTSNFYEGWGAVLNEAMNSGCAVVASHSIGSAPFLIENCKNGYMYRYGDLNDMYFKVENLIKNKKLQLELGLNAYGTISSEWNEKVAAERFLELASCLMKKDDCELFDTGPCSKASVIKNNWF